MKKYKIWNCGQTSFSDEIPEGMPVVGANGFRFITNKIHYMAAGYPLELLPEEEADKPAHFNLPFAEFNA